MPDFRGESVSLRRRWTSTLKAIRTQAKDVLSPTTLETPQVNLPQSPVPHLECSNQPPTESELLLIVDAIAKAEAEAVRLSVIIWEHKAKRETDNALEVAITQMIDQANRFAREQKALVSPVRRLPPEILWEIFSWMLYDTAVKANPIRRSNALIPWKLGLVCKTWRSTALGMPTLWRMLPTINLSKSKAKTKSQLRYIRELLHRSMNTPLDICICANSFNQESHPVFHLLFENVERWETLLLDVGPKTFSGLYFITGRLSSLKVLNLTMRWMDGPANYAALQFSYFAEAPLLTSVTLTEPSLNGEITLPYSQLVHYTETSSVRIGNRMRRTIVSSTLETLTMLHLDDEAIFPDITLPCLKKLYIKFHFRTHSNCFNNLTIPVIEDIAIVSYQGQVMESLIYVLSKSSPSSLKTLRLRVGAIGDGELSSLLEQTPSLLNLDVTLPPSGSSDINHLAFGYHGQHLVPLLETCDFFLDRIVINQDMAKALNGLAAARCENGGGGTIDIMNGAGILPGGLRRLKKLSFVVTEFPWGYLNQAYLENWAPMAGSSTLLELRGELHGLYPSLSSTYTAGRIIGRPKAFDGESKRKIDRILDAIESVEVDDVRDIYLSNLHFSLKTMAQSWTLRGHNERAKTILDKWNPMIEASLQDRHWTFKGCYSLAYIPDDDALRATPEAMDIAFALKEDSPFHSIFWPTYL